MIIKVNKMCKKYENGSIMTDIFNNYSLEIKEGEKIAIMGASGSGKSTLLHILAGLEEFQAGEVIVDGINYIKTNYKKIVPK